MTERKHHNFSPSTLQALECCPSFEGRQSFSKAADDGTRQHAVAETGQDDETLTDEQVEAVAEALAFVAGQKQILQEEALRTGGEVLDLRETYLPVDEVDTSAGTADRILISADGKNAILVDHKFGKWAVECASNNRQSDAYALSIFHAFPKVELVNVHFFQPAIKSVNAATWTRADVPELLLRIRVIVARAKAAREARDFSTANPTTPVCLFCKHLAVCPAVAEKVISIAKKFAPLDVPADLTPTRVHSPEEAATGLRLAGIVEAWAKAFRTLVTDRVLRGGTPPAGYELTSRATREIINAERFREIALAFVMEADYVSLMSPPALTVIEKSISDWAPRGQKSQTVAAFRAAAEAAGAVQKRAPFAFLRQKTAED